MSRERSLVGAASLLVTLGLAAGAWAQCESTRLIDPDGEGNDHFGNAVSVSGETAMVGSPWDRFGRGSVSVFERLDEGWGWVARLTIPGGDMYLRFGTAVALDGDTALVGVPGDDALGTLSGAVYEFEKIGGVWTVVGQLTASDGWGADAFGIRVCLRGDTGVVVNNRVDEDEFDMRTAYVFERVGGEWTETARLTADDAAKNDHFGDSISVSGGTIVAGAWGDDDLGHDSGSVYVFEKPRGGWSQVAKLTAPDGATDDNFGCSVAVEGGTIVVGSRLDDDLGHDSGSVYVYERSGGAWTLAGKLHADDGVVGDLFGDAVALSDDRIVVGAPGHYTGDIQSSAYVFARAGGAWSEVSGFSTGVPWEGAENDLLTVSVSGRTALLGMNYDDYLGWYTGSARVFDIGCACPADFDANYQVDVRDVLALLNAWVSGDPRADWDGSGTVDTADFLAFLNDWAAGC